MSCSKRPFEFGVRRSADRRVGCFQPNRRCSLELIRSLRPPPRSVMTSARRVPPGRPHRRRWRRQVTVLDISEHALAAVSERLGDHPGVSFVVADIHRLNPPQTWDVWHDRAVFHFLTETGLDRAGYTSAVVRAVASGGVAVIGMLRADRTKTSCSGSQSCSTAQRRSPLGSPPPSSSSDRNSRSISTPVGSRNPSRESLFADDRSAESLCEPEPRHWRHRSAVGVPDPAWNPRKSTLAIAAR